MTQAGEVFTRLAYFEGHVQGVGFRYQCLQIARGYEATGTVKNLADGRVELFAEGEEAEIDSFIEEIKDKMDSYIRRVEIKDEIQKRRFNDFLILPGSH